MKSRILSFSCCLGMLASAPAFAQEIAQPPPGYGYGVPQMPYSAPEGVTPYGYPAAGTPGAEPYPAPPGQSRSRQRAERGPTNPMERMMTPMGKMSEPAGQMTKPMGRMMEPMREMLPGSSERSGAAPGYGQPPATGPGGYGYPPGTPPSESSSKNPMSQMMAPAGRMMDPMKSMMGSDKKGAPQTQPYDAPPPYTYPPAAGGYGYGPGPQGPGAAQPMPMPGGAPQY